jgi:ribosome biogenesis GTPase
VVRVERGGSLVATADGEHLVPPRPDVVPAVGDWVGVRWHGDHPVPEQLAPRSSELSRYDPEGMPQVLAANIDIVFVTAPADRLSPSRVERETAAAWGSGATPVVLVTKGDLAAPGLVTELDNRLLGVEVLLTSAVTGDGTDLVADALRPARTAVLLGPSGAGKSSLVNALLGTDHLAVGPVRSGDRRGRHTTTSRQLVPVPTGGVLIDTPGLRTFTLAGDDGLGSAFPEVESLAAGCRFADCRHDTEPGCAVTDAVSAGGLDPARLASFRKLQRELDFEARRNDPLARREAERVWKIRAKAARRINRDR